MEIYYTDISKHIKNTETKAKIKKMQHKYSKLLLKKIATEIYNIRNPKIKLRNNKPYFVNSKINFSITHSENIVLIAFDENNIGIDIEKIKPRDFERLSKRYNLKDNDPKTFYKFWTKYEAELKLQDSAKTIITIPFNDFIITAAGNFSKKYNMIKTEI